MKGLETCNLRLGLSLVCACLVIPFCASQAQVYTISGPNAYLQGDADSLDHWVVNGTDFLSLQAAYYRIGASGGETLLGGGVYNPVTGYVTHQPIAGLTIVNAMNLTASGGSSLLNQTITINNNTGSALDLHFFQYSDFTLPGAPMETATLAAPTAFGYGRVTQSFAGVGNIVSTLSSRATRADTGFAASLLASLSDSNPTTLGNNMTAAGDVAWVWQWDATIANGGGKVLSIIYSVPEPSVLGLGFVGLFVWYFRNRRTM